MWGIPLITPDPLCSDNPGGKPAALNVNGFPSGLLAVKVSATLVSTLVVWLAGEIITSGPVEKGGGWLDPGDPGPPGALAVGPRMVGSPTAVGPPQTAPSPPTM